VLSVIACVPMGWSHFSDSSTTPIFVYYGHMIAMEGVATSEARCTAKPYPAAPARSTPLDYSGRHRVGRLVCSFGFG
jgi:hypothetical protein